MKASECVRSRSVMLTDKGRRVLWFYYLGIPLPPSYTTSGYCERGHVLRSRGGCQACTIAARRAQTEPEAEAA
jgi:hypothetical protein